MKQCSANTGKGKKDPENAEGLPFRSGLHRDPRNYINNNLQHENSNLAKTGYKNTGTFQNDRTNTREATEASKKGVGNQDTEKQSK